MLILKLTFVLLRASATFADSDFPRLRSELATNIVNALIVPKDGPPTAVGSIEPLIKTLFELERQTDRLNETERREAIKSTIALAWRDAKASRPELGGLFNPARGALRKSMQREAKLGVTSQSPQAHGRTAN